MSRNLVWGKRISVLLLKQSASVIHQSIAMAELSREGGLLSGSRTLQSIDHASDLCFAPYLSPSFLIFSPLNTSSIRLSNNAVTV